MNKYNWKRYLSIFLFLIVVIGFVTISLFNFYKKIKLREYKNQVESLKEHAVHGKNVVENKLEGYLNSLKGIEVFLEKEDLHSERNMAYLLEITEKEYAYFQRIALADRDGHSVFSSGATANVKDRQFFKACMEKRAVVTGRKNSDIIPNRLVFIVAVPVLNQAEEVIGVLYGVVEVDKFQLYPNQHLDPSSQYIQIIDQNGVYISREHVSKMMFEDKNLFEGMHLVETDLPVEQLIQKIENREYVLTEIAKGDDERLVYFTPLEINDWYVVTVMKKKEIVETVQYLLANDVYFLMFKVIGAVSLVAALLLYYSSKDKKGILKLNEQLKFNEEIFEIASNKFNFTIMIYNMKSQKLKCINNSLIHFQIPSVIEQAPKNFSKLFPYEATNIQNLNRIFENIGKDKALDNFDMPFTIGGETRHLRIQIHYLVNKKGEIAQCVGIMTDITEQVRLEKEVQVRGTLSNTLGFMEIDLDEDLILYGSHKLMKVCERFKRFSDYTEWVIHHSIIPEYRAYAKERLSISFLKNAFNRGVQDIKSEYECRKANGELIWLECAIHLERDRESGHIMAYNVLRDIHTNKQAELELREQADKDELTGLYNRRKGIEKIDQILQESDFNQDTIHAFLIFDLDHFKMLNDTLGHHMGDTALKEVAEILRHHFRSYDVLCRLGGDEFVVFLRDIPREVLEKNVESLLKKLHLCYGANLYCIDISASVGIALAPYHGTSFKELYHKADNALYKAKEDGKNVFKIFSEGEL